MTAVADDQAANTFRTMKLMCRQGKQVDGDFLQIDGKLAGRLGGIDMKQHPSLHGEIGHFGDRLHDAGFVIGVLQRNQQSVGPQRPRHSIRLDPPGAVGA